MIYSNYLEMFLFLRQTFMDERFRPFNDDMTEIHKSLTENQLQVIEELGVLTNGYLTCIEFMMNYLKSGREDALHINLVDHIEDMFLDSLSNVTDERVLKYRNTYMKHASKRVEVFVSLLFDVYELIRPVKYRREKEIYTFMRQHKDWNLEIVSSESDRVEVSKDQIIFNIEPKEVIDKESIDTLYIMPSFTASRKVTFWRTESSLLFYVKLDHMNDDVLEPSDLLNLSMSALSDKTRLKMLKYLSIKPFSVSDLAKQLGMNPSTVSRHMKLFKDAGYVEILEKNNNIVIYTLKREGLNKGLQLLKDYIR